MKQHSRITPRLIRFRDAPRYLGMDRNRFNAEVRPYLVEIRIGKQGIAFDRLELDAFAEQYISRNGCPGKPMGELPWPTKRHPASLSGAKSGTSTKGSAESAFKAALKQVASKKPKPS
jgi:hypothetical protein